MQLCKNLNLQTNFLDTHGIGMAKNRLFIRKFKKSYDSMDVMGVANLLAQTLQEVVSQGNKGVVIAVETRDSKTIAITANGHDIVTYKKVFFWTLWKVKRTQERILRYNSKTLDELGDRFLSGMFGCSLEERPEENFAAA